MRSRWPGQALAATAQRWANDDEPATVEPEFLHDTTLGELVDELDFIAKSGDDADLGHLNAVVDAIYDEADTGDVRTWLTFTQTFQEP